MNTVKNYDNLMKNNPKYAIFAYNNPPKLEKEVTINFERHVKQLIKFHDKRRRGVFHLEMDALFMEMLMTWSHYPRAYAEKYADDDSTMRMDKLMQDNWIEIGKGLHAMLDHETGGLDCGSISHNMNELAKLQEIKLFE